MARLSILSIDLWKRHEERIISMVAEALGTLCLGGFNGREENDINRALDISVRKCSADRGYPYCIMLDSKNQPNVLDDSQEDRERKRPDIQVIWVDPTTELEWMNYQKHYTIECKLLGRMPGRRLDVEYVELGIKRFTTKEHGYAEGVSSGAMVGYVQNTHILEILTNVNVVAEGFGFSKISFSEVICQDSRVSRFIQNLHRTEMMPNQLSLHHLWVDLREGSDIC